MTIPAGGKPWHGAKKDSWFSHVAVEVPGEGRSSKWLEPVSGEAYAVIVRDDSGEAYGSPVQGELSPTVTEGVYGWTKQKYVESSEISLPLGEGGRKAAG